MLFLQEFLEGWVANAAGLVPKIFFGTQPSQMTRN